MRYVGKKKDGGLYCRKCIAFTGELAEKKERIPKLVTLDLKYPLSKEQKELSDKVIANFAAGIDTLVYAVCGSGKTEISYGVIAYAMAKGLRVGFALPRRDVVIELFFRLKEAFPHNRIVAVYGQHTSCLVGDCVILTTHQLYRYPDYFDLLVMDEVDAFPYKGNEVLIAICKRSICGHCVMMSATPSQTVIDEFSKPGHEMLSLRTRFHRHPIPVPKIVIRPGLSKYITLIRALSRYKKEKKPCFVFVPTVGMSKSLFGVLSLFLKNGNYVSSKKEDRDETIEAFKKGKADYLVTTAVLERGVTIKNLQVIVFDSDSPIYDSSALIQIAGRAGRKADAPTGEVLFLCDKETHSMKEAVREIEFCNTYL